MRVPEHRLECFVRPFGPYRPGRWKRQVKNGDRLSLATARADGNDVVVATNVERDDFHQDTEHGGFEWQRKVFLDHRVPTGGLLRFATR